MLPDLIWKWLEQKFVFFPTSEIEFTPADAGIVYEDVFFPTDAGFRLHGWYVPGVTDTTWLWFHGNGGNVGHRVAELALLHQRLGMNLLIFDYQGYGRSEGSPTENGTYQDARAALRYLVSRRQLQPDSVSDKIIYVGHSLGAAIAIELATEHAPAGMVLASPFASVSDMSRIVFPLLPSGWLVRDRYNSRDRISKVSCPLLILHGENDTMVPISQAQKLFDAANSPKMFQALPGTGHNYTFEQGGEAYWGALGRFLASLRDGWATV